MNMAKKVRAPPFSINRSPHGFYLKDSTCLLLSQGLKLMRAFLNLSKENELSKLKLRNNKMKASKFFL